MRISWKSLSAGGAALVAYRGLALSQSAAPPAPTLPAIRGELERFTLTGRGDVDGFILKDGTEVKTAPTLSAQIAAIAKPGDRLTVHGLKAAALPLVQAVAVTDETSKQTVDDAGAPAARTLPPPPPPPAPRAPRAAALPPAAGGAGPAPLPVALSETSGRVRMALHGPQGEVNGALLESGAILRFPPDRGTQLTTLIQPQHAIVAEGISLTNALGTVVEVQQLGASRTQLVALTPPAGPRRP